MALVGGYRTSPLMPKLCTVLLRMDASDSLAKVAAELHQIGCGSLVESNSTESNHLLAPEQDAVEMHVGSISSLLDPRCRLKTNTITPSPHGPAAGQSLPCPSTIAC